jgi:ABC-type phosphate/phosphonate transport system permease subunit
MNLLAEADAPITRKLLIFAVVFVVTISLTVYAMAKSKRLSDFLDVLTDERSSFWQKCKAFALVWQRDED